jgi:2-dehydro-3-deoxyglucarate aldolase/4-hydroxy-2-oxoheptanedioate aldolase
MRENPVKAALARGQTALGTMIFAFRSDAIGTLAAGAGAEFAIFDMEHTGWSTETVARLIACARATPIVPMVRVPAAQYQYIARTLDVGAMGVMVPLVETAEQAQLIARAAKYPPVGRRGAAFGFAHDDYVAGDVLATIRSANAEGLLIAQIETEVGLRNIDAIAAVEGIDVVWVGHFDLTNFLGIPAQFDHPEYLGALDRIVAIARRHGKAAGFMASSVDEARQYIARGFRIIAYWGDTWIYQDALRRALVAIRNER